MHSFLGKAFRLADNDFSEDERRALMEKAMEDVGLNASELLFKRPHELSGGQRQRLMIARALLIGPELLVADEPTSMIDASSRVGILNMLMDLSRKHGMTIMFITHDIGLAYYTSDRLLIMNEGRIVEEGSAEEVVERPTNAYTKRLLADIPTLRWSGQLVILFVSADKQDPALDRAGSSMLAALVALIQGEFYLFALTI